MARDRGNGDGANPPRGRGGEPESVAAAQEAAAQKAQRGRAGQGEVGRRQAAPTDTSLITQSTGEPGGVPTGRPTLIDPAQQGEARRSLERENSAAAILAGHGYQIRQNPTRGEVEQARQDTGDTGNAKSRPDYLLEGRVFDCYSPRDGTSVRNIGSEVKKKVVREQTQRVVVNLQDWSGDMPALQKQFDDWPVAGLKEVKAIKPDGTIVQIVPHHS